MHTLTNSERRHNLHIQVDSTGFHASKLINNAGEVNRLRVSFSIPSSAAKLFNLNRLIDARRYVKINFSLLNDLSQDAIETETVCNSCNAILKFGKTSSPYETINVKRPCGLAVCSNSSADDPQSTTGSLNLPGETAPIGYCLLIQQASSRSLLWSLKYF